MRGFLLTTALRYKKHTSSMVNRYMKLINAEYDQSVAPSLDLDEITRKSILDKYKLDNQNKIVVLCPDAEFGPAKRWPVEYWRELIKILNKDGFIPTILGKNTSLAKEISSDNTSQKYMLVGLTNLEEAIYILSSAEVVVSNDSGLMHLSAATGIPTLGLFGPTDDKLYSPTGKNAFFIRTPKSPKELMNIPNFNHRTSPTLMDTLTVEMVENRVKDLLLSTK